MDATEHAAAPELVSDSGASADEAGLVAEEPVSLDAIAHHGALIAQQLLADELAPLLGDTLAQLKGLTDKLAGLRQAVDAKLADLGEVAPPLKRTRGTSSQEEPWAMSS